jgi:hypothetical protein
VHNLPKLNGYQSFFSLEDGYVDTVVILFYLAAFSNQTSLTKKNLFFNMPLAFLVSYWFNMWLLLVSKDNRTWYNRKLAGVALSAFQRQKKKSANTSTMKKLQLPPSYYI